MHNCCGEHSGCCGEEIETSGIESGQSERLSSKESDSAFTHSSSEEIEIIDS